MPFLRRSENSQADTEANSTVVDISAADISFRRIPPLLVVNDPKVPGGRRASSAAFGDDPDGSSMSVYIRSIVFELGLTEADVIHGKQAGWAVAAIPNQTLIDEEQLIRHKPEVDSLNPHPCDPAHALVHGNKGQKARRDRIARSAPLIHIVS